MQFHQLKNLIRLPFAGQIIIPQGFHNFAFYTLIFDLSLKLAIKARFPIIRSTHDAGRDELRNRSRLTRPAGANYLISGDCFAEGIIFSFCLCSF